MDVIFLVLGLIAFAISGKPKMLLCDDPIAGLDAKNSQLTKKGITLAN